MNRRSRFARRLPTLRAARHRRERHTGATSTHGPSAAGRADASALDDWGAAAVELGLVAQPTADAREPARP